MAEKEERIWIGTTEKKIQLKQMTRQEAIRKMCDAYFKAKDEGLMESERVVAALNALLS